MCVYVCVAAAHSVLFDSAGLIRHPAPWQRQGLNSSVKSLSTQTHACSPQRRRERIERSRRRGYLCCLRYNAWGSLQSLCPCFSRACLPNSFQPGLAERKAEGGKKARGRIVKSVTELLTGNAGRFWPLVVTAGWTSTDKTREEEE